MLANPPRHPYPPTTEGAPLRKLTLKKDVLAELTSAELTGVVGGALTLKDWCAGPTLSLTCTSAVDACLTARGCTYTLDLC